MSLGAFWSQIVAMMVVFCLPVALIVAFIVYKVFMAVNRGATPMEGVADVMVFVNTILLPAFVSFVVTTAIRYISRWWIYSKHQGFVHPMFETIYWWGSMLTYMFTGPVHVVIRGCYSLLSFAFRIGNVDEDLIGFGLDYNYGSYLGIVESMRVKNEFEAICRYKVKGTHLEPTIGNGGDGGGRKNKRFTEFEGNSIHNVLFDAEEKLYRDIELNSNKITR
tara:strand:+ start:329 stop:991 length:663 start_codon:yes stop_codon:yes gene_type:complete